MVLQTVRLKSDKMATENSTLPVSGEHLDSSVVEDTQNNSVPADGGETNAAVADDTDVPTQSRVDFADEDAALAAENAGLDLGEASPEEEAAGGDAAGSDLAGKSKEELLAIFARMLEERPVPVPAPGCGGPQDSVLQIASGGVRCRTKGFCRSRRCGG